MQLLWQEDVNKTTLLVWQINHAEVILNYTNNYPNGTVYPQGQQTVNLTTGSGLG